ncbi:g1921 [Coccomyxa viridis]|uniref:G1921 protein n=1 Tax=Coccomyxa viridis TaxID=1274662 RepID=A0ABP1FJ51_9CHLO
MHFLPDAVVKEITGHLFDGESEQSAVLSLMSACGVCRQWRDVARRLDSGILRFDSLKNRKGRALTDSEKRFKNSSAQAKEALFQSAAQLLQGYTHLVLCGEGVTDVTLVEAARANGAKLLSVEVKDTATVTDAGLATLALFAPNLKSVRLSCLPRVCGGFISGLLASCPHLEELHLESLPACWEASDNGTNVKAPNVHTMSMKGCKLTIAAANLLARLPNLRMLHYEGAPALLRVASSFCPKMEEVSYSTSCPDSVNEALLCLLAAPKLHTLELTPRNMTLAPEHMHVLGMLPLTELRLNSYLYSQQPAINRASQSHIDNDGVRALVDAICQRCSARPGFQPKPFKLSLCGATALTHDAVSALLRLPMLSDLKIDGCYRITSMDKMRLVAKVKAGASFGSPSPPRSRGACCAQSKRAAYTGTSAHLLRAAA